MESRDNSVQTNFSNVIMMRTGIGYWIFIPDKRIFHGSIEIYRKIRPDMRLSLTLPVRSVSVQYRRCNDNITS
ncbi:hypothetical protein QQG55_25270 [Brugia pahangi]|uniref:Transposase n=1 Tax=Brugia pahangi TaxID=6280 RepID=A0A0N4T0N2_BRUPA|nr:unnamed protein product [Brugia pahangi]